jgi:hypothetical protein
MKGGKGSKNNIANRGSGAKSKFYNGKKVIAVLLNDRKNNRKFIAASYEDGSLVTSPDGGFVKYDSISMGSGTETK